MNTRPSKLDAILDRVPVARLEAAIMRRTAARQKLSDEDRAEFEEAIRRIRKRHHIPRCRILSADKDAHAMAARWALYEMLLLAGWCVVKIHRATGHDRTRIYHGLRRRGHLPPAPRHATARD